MADLKRPPIRWLLCGLSPTLMVIAAAIAEYCYCAGRPETVKVLMPLACLLILLLIPTAPSAIAAVTASEEARRLTISFLLNLFLSTMLLVVGMICYQLDPYRDQFLAELLSLLSLLLTIVSYGLWVRACREAA